MSFTQMPGPIIRAKCVPIRIRKSTSVNIAAGPARNRGNNAIRYIATSKNTSNETQTVQPGVRKKCSLRMLDTECESASIGVNPPIGVT